MSSSRKVLTVVVLVPALIALALCAFIWPSARLEPRDLPLGVAGPPQATAPVEARLAERGDAFDVHTYPDVGAARTAVEEREVYGAVVATPGGPELLVASAAGPAVAQLLTEAAGEQAAGRPVPTEDVVPLPSADPRGSVLNSSVLPLALAGIVVGGAVTLLGLRGGRAVCAVVGASAAVGLVGATVADTWLGALTGGWWVQAGALGLTALAGAAAVAGLAAVLGRAGMGLGSLLVMLLGNPFSGVSSAPEMLPEPAGVLGQWLPPGAGGSLIRSVAYFDGNGGGEPLAVLAGWTLAGLALLLLGPLLGRRHRRDHPDSLEPAAGRRIGERASA
ncbi:ABC transporter permease [Streptomyces sp. WMMC500]|uniref:ABC transporter permease n=1 Tax=Streptomyces sp. WMMC500 TaxID=3015154 RepID=UPI00248D03D9|nr:ABC transporter permease [Streptomyces sp. WMMC500]WBB63091.1 ABC transporter permease [Streptomyces sp. WMMC500]